MTSHELARQLLELPDLPVAVFDGSDPADFEEATLIKSMNDGDGVFWSETNPQWESCSHIRII